MDAADGKKVANLYCLSVNKLRTEPLHTLDCNTIKGKERRYQVVKNGAKESYHSIIYCFIRTDDFVRSRTEREERR